MMDLEDARDLACARRQDRIARNHHEKRACLEHGVFALFSFFVVKLNSFS